MIYTKISPLGPRRGPGTFDGVWNADRYKRMEDAIAANDLVVIDFVKDEKGIIYFELYHTKDPDAKRHYELEIQYFDKRGVDVCDDDAALRLANKILKFF